MLLAAAFRYGQFPVTTPTRLTATLGVPVEVANVHEPVPGVGAGPVVGVHVFKLAVIAALV